MKLIAIQRLFARYSGRWIMKTSSCFQSTSVTHQHLWKNGCITSNNDCSGGH